MTESATAVEFDASSKELLDSPMETHRGLRDDGCVCLIDRRAFDALSRFADVFGITV